MQVPGGIRLPWAFPVVLMFQFASAQLASFNGGFLDNVNGGLAAFGQDNNGTPDLLQLVRRQQRVCPANAPVDCGPSGCCASGQFCCTNVDGCCPTDSNCYSQPRGCCPKSAETCNKGFCLLPGQTCCGVGACNQGFVCLQSPSGRQTCCLSGMTACNDGTCCFEGTKCSTSSPGKCERISLSTSALSSLSRSSTASATRPPSPTRPPTTSTSPSQSQKTPKVKCKSTPSYSIPNSKRTAIPEPVEDHLHPRAAGLTISKRQDESGSGFEEYCDTDEEEKIPVMLFPWFPGETDELIESTCGGIRQFGGTDELLLTWAGDGPVAAGKRRAKNCPSGYCTSIGQKQNKNYPRDNECDEFPPASTEESAQGSHVLCIDRLQNQLGGKLIQSYRWIYRLQPKQKFIIRVIPNCNKFASAGKHKRSYGHGENLEGRDVADQFSVSNSSWLQDRRPGAESGVGWVFGSIPELSSGNYNITFNFNGPVMDLSVFDSAGLEYLRLPSATSGQSFNFTVEEGLPLGVAAYARKDANINLSYNGKRMPNSTTKGSLAVPAIRSPDTHAVGVALLIFVLIEVFL